MTQVAIVCVPFIRFNEHALYALQTIASLNNQKTGHTLDTIAIVNGIRTDSSDHDWIESSFAYYEFNDANNLSRAWNKGIMKGFERGAKYVLVLNLDIVLHPLSIQNLVTFYDTHPDAYMVSPNEWADQNTLEQAELHNTSSTGISFSCFMIDRKLFQDIGLFDEQFGPAYHEDADMSYRMSLKNCPLYRISSALYWHLDRGTIKAALFNNDTRFLQLLREDMDASMKRYEAKWGGLPASEKFKTPYNR